jgi:cell division protein ZapA
MSREYIYQNQYKNKVKFKSQYFINLVETRPETYGENFSPVSTVSYPEEISQELEDLREKYTKETTRLKNLIKELKEKYENPEKPFLTLRQQIDQLKQENDKLKIAKEDFDKLKDQVAQLKKEKETWEPESEKKIQTGIEAGLKTARDDLKKLQESRKEALRQKYRQLEINKLLRMKLAGLSYDEKLLDTLENEVLVETEEEREVIVDGKKIKVKIKIPGWWKIVEKEVAKEMGEPPSWGN